MHGKKTEETNFLYSVVMDSFVKKGNKGFGDGRQGDGKGEGAEWKALGSRAKKEYCKRDQQHQQKRGNEGK